MKRFFQGFSFVIEGLQSIRHGRGLLKWALLPFFTVFFLFSAAVLSSFYWGPPLLEWAFESYGLNSLDSHSAWTILLFIILGIALFVSFAYVSYLSISLVSAPFHSVLAEKVLQQLGQKDLSGFRLSFFFGALIKVMILGFAGLSFLLGSVFIPGVNIASAFFLFFVIAYDSADYSLELLGYSYKRRVQFVKTYWIEFCGMSTFVGLTLFLPGLILLLMPAAVAGSAVLVFRLHHSAREVA